MFTDEVVSIATRLGRVDDLKEIEAEILTHDKYFIAKTTFLQPQKLWETIGSGSFPSV